jgi:lipopolysaccharide export LptBFGC system permease protein LptF
MNNKVLIKKAENQVRQQLFGGVVLGVLGLMLAVTFGNINIKVKAADNAVNLTFNVTAGAFTLASLTTDIAWPSVTYNTVNATHGANAGLDNIVVTDHRGNATAWTLTAAANNFAAGTNDISKAQITLHIANGTITNDEGDFNFVTKGANANLASARNVMSGNASATGIYNYDLPNTGVRLNVVGNEAAGDYTAVLTLTLT